MEDDKNFSTFEGHNNQGPTINNTQEEQKEKQVFKEPIKKEIHREHIQQKPKKTVKLNKVAIWKTISGLLIIALAFSIFQIYKGNNNQVAPLEIPTGAATKGLEQLENILSQEQAEEKIEKFLNEKILQGGVTATIKSITEESGLYKVLLSVQGQEFDSYLTKDGTVFFPQGLDTEMEVPKAKEGAKEPEQKEVPKSEKPKVEVFVMSHCPFGTQIEKGIIPVANLLKDKIDLEIKFCDYAMHGEKEIKEQLNQYCIQKEFNDKFMDYLTCFLKEDNGPGCLEEIGIDQDKLTECTKATDEEFEVTKKLKDQSTWTSRFPPFDIHKKETTEYGVRGSPSLVINGVSVNSNRDSQSLLNTICEAFTDKPAECDKELSSEQPSPGFGFEPGTGGPTGSCG